MNTKTKEEMDLLLSKVGEVVVVEILEEQHSKSEKGKLIEVVPYKAISIKESILQTDIPFIGICGILKITEEKTGVILYENTVLNFEKKIFKDTDEEVLKEINKLREAKYGTNEFAATELRNSNRS